MAVERPIGPPRASAEISVSSFIGDGERGGGDRLPTREGEGAEPPKRQSDIGGGANSCPMSFMS